MAIFWIAMCFFAASQNNTLLIDLKHFAGDRTLILDSGNYKNALDQELRISKFKYYLGKICLRTKTGKDFFSNEYFLVDEDKEGSKQIRLTNVPAGNYSSIEFIVGVDSADNCSGAQSGALDPVNGMFWAWNTGYIFLKLEGTSNYSRSPGHFFEYHVGGYKQPVNCIRKVKLALGLIVINNTANPTIQLKVDALEILKTPQAINLSALSSVTDAKNATLIADNYSDMFRILTTDDEK